ncbi:MAG: PstS family phosphate ABC transporter substrate-binding protein [Bacteroidales bacterium]|nr:PstS family phosphate ABC transporter substrate-binding protein [Bacteroidales bacterium]MDD2322689.1 PstS family phosphate ABC transporter substrate-binding protein [Bacteroidales bacterium]MDD3010673.1 PstS family phosphate ABC transporter substrate-binding protein [Bacteroidales bacterium]MDD3961704.1 PstS family phosphate ABC transporter substrate-binding protein [Bacteroidales bacterium]MDY0285291.1 PstS family phosphate ABC transporter substrate-binding protein [Bacteroidales bacterium
MKNRAFLLLLIIPLLFLSCNGRQSQEKKQSAVNISGAFALYPLTVRWAEAFMEENPEIRINISAGGAGKGMADALSEMVDLGMFSREVMPEEIAKGAWNIAVARDAVLPTLNKSNPYLSRIQQQGVTQAQFKALFIDNSLRCWDEFFGEKCKTPVNLYTRSDACGAAAMWAAYLHSDQEELAGTGVFGDPGLADAVKNDIYGIGFNNVVYIYDLQTRQKYPGLEVIPLDLNADGMISSEENFYSTVDDMAEAIKAGIYPSPPARDLYFVAHGKPKKSATLKFLKWILTEGQKYVCDAGYVSLSEEKLSGEMKKIR